MQNITSLVAMIDTAQSGIDQASFMKSSIKTPSGEGESLFANFLASLQKGDATTVTPNKDTGVIVPVETNVREQGETALKERIIKAFGGEDDDEEQDKFKLANMVNNEDLTPLQIPAMEIRPIEPKIVEAPVQVQEDIESQPLIELKKAEKNINLLKQDSGAIDAQPEKTLKLTKTIKPEQEGEPIIENILAEEGSEDLKDHKFYSLLNTTKKEGPDDEQIRNFNLIMDKMKDDFQDIAQKNLKPIEQNQNSNEIAQGSSEDNPQLAVQMPASTPPAKQEKDKDEGEKDEKTDKIAVQSIDNTKETKSNQNFKLEKDEEKVEIKPLQNEEIQSTAMMQSNSQIERPRQVVTPQLQPQQFQEAMQASESNVMEQVQVKISGIKNTKDQTISVELHPKELGKVNITFEKVNDITSVHFMIEKPEVLEMLKGQAMDLATNLNNSGLEISTEQMSFNLQQQNPNNGGGNNAPVPEYKPYLNNFAEESEENKLLKFNIVSNNQVDIKV